MTTFKTFVDRLNEEHTAAKARYSDIEKAWTIAQREYEAAKADTKAPETVRLIAQGDYLKAQEAYKKDMLSLRDMHRQYINEIRTDMQSFVDSYYLATPDKMDDKAVQLLNSGIMGVADLEHMAAQHRHNPVMLRLIGKKADEIIAANPHDYSQKETATRQRATGLRYRIREAEDSGKAMEAFNAIADLSANAFEPDSHWAKTTDKHWERYYADTCAAYDNFLVQPNSGADSSTGE